MNNNKKIIIVSIVIIILLAVLFATVQFINKKSKPENVLTEQEIKMYYTTQQVMYLTPEKRIIQTDNLFKNTINELIKGPKDSSLNKTIPEGVELLGINVKNGLARVDFNRALVDNHWGGSTGERMTIYSIVNTLTQFKEIEKVMILIDGDKVKTLAGHLDLSEPLTRNEKIIKK